MGAGRHLSNVGRCLVLPLSGLLALAGCGLATVEDAREEAHEVARDAAAARAGVPAGPGYVTVRLLDRPWVGLEPIEEAKPRLPERLLTEDAVTLPLAGAHDDAVLAARIEAATGIPVRFVGAARGDEDTSFATTDLYVPNGTVWTGPLDRLLDAWTEAAGHEWQYEPHAGHIEIVRRRTAVFRVNALAGTERHGASSSTQDQAGEDGSSSLSTQSIESETVYDPWPEIEAQIAGLVDEETTVTVSPASASVTVSGAPADVRKVRGYLGWLNREVLRPVTLSVHLYAVLHPSPAGTRREPLSLPSRRGRSAIVRTCRTSPPGVSTRAPSMRWTPTIPVRWCWSCSSRRSSAPWRTAASSGWASGWFCASAA